MMNKFLRFYNQNRVLFWISVAIIFIAFGLTRVLNSYYKNAKEESSGNNATTSNIIVQPIISGTKQEEQDTNNQVEIIEEFINLLNNGNVEAAYNMLSEDCKKNIFPEMEEFKERYYNNIFNQKKLLDYELWVINNNRVTYRITLTDDLLATGGTGNKNLQDYYTIVYEESNYKLNIMNFIGTENIDELKSEENFEITIKEKMIYADYEVYRVEIKNKTPYIMTLDSKNNTRTTYIVDKNNYKYYSFLNEIVDESLKIKSGMKTELDIKFNKTYNPKYIIEKICFDDVIFENSNETSTMKISIEI